MAGLFVLALLVAGFQMIEPLFMRFMIDRICSMTRSTPPAGSAGFTWPAPCSSPRSSCPTWSGHRDYRQRLLNVRVMLSSAGRCSTGCSTSRCRSSGT
ncbi:MAG: hypothetical protein R2882_11365 [Gemmatimonadales bacterium]